jgi:hypothetical protein
MSKPVLLLKSKVLLKSIVTDTYKKDRIAQFELGIKECERNVETIRTKLLSLSLPLDDQKMFDQEVGKIETQSHMLKENMILLSKVKEGDMFTDGMMEGLVSVKPGDDIRDKVKAMEIVSKDYIVQTVAYKDNGSLKP